MEFYCIFFVAKKFLFSMSNIYFVPKSKELYSMLFFKINCHRWVSNFQPFNFFYLIQKSNIAAQTYYVYTILSDVICSFSWSIGVSCFCHSIAICEKKLNRICMGFSNNPLQTLDLLAFYIFIWCFYLSTACGLASRNFSWPYRSVCCCYNPNKKLKALTEPI